MPQDLRAAAERMTALGDALVRANNEATRLVSDAVLHDALRLSGGMKTPADLRAADHPYATRHGEPLWNPVPINVGTGLFRDSWRIEVAVGESGIETRLITNDSAVGEFLQFGTRTMFARPLASYLDQVRRDSWERIAPPLFAAAVQNALQR